MSEVTFFNFDGLRKIRGHSKNGPNRREMKIGMTPETFAIMEHVVPVGKGKFASALIETTLRAMLILVTEGEDIPMAGEELKMIIASPYFTNNLRALAAYIDKNP